MRSKVEKPKRRIGGFFMDGWGAGDRGEGNGVGRQGTLRNEKTRRTTDGSRPLGGCFVKSEKLGGEER